MGQNEGIVFRQICQFRANSEQEKCELMNSVVPPMSRIELKKKKFSQNDSLHSINPAIFGNGGHLELEGIYISSMRTVPPPVLYFEVELEFRQEE